MCYFHTQHILLLPIFYLNNLKYIKFESKCLGFIGNLMMILMMAVMNTFNDNFDGDGVGNK